METDFIVATIICGMIAYYFFKRFVDLFFIKILERIWGNNMRKQIVFRGKTYEVIKEYEDCYLTVDEHLNRKKFPKLTIVKWCMVQVKDLHLLHPWF